LCSRCQSPCSKRERKAAYDRPTFDRERFVDDCLRAGRETDSQRAIGEVLRRAVADHAAVLAALGPPTQAGLDVLHQSPELTIHASKWNE